MRIARRASPFLLAALAALPCASCTDEVQLAPKRIERTTAPPPEATDPDPNSDADPDPDPAAPPTRDDYCAGRGLPASAELIAPGASAQACLQPAPRVFRYGLCTCADAVFSGGVGSDAFDSSRAPYAPGQGGGNVGVNGQLVATGPVELLGSLTVAGSGVLPINVSPFRVAGTLRANGDVSITAADTRIERDLWVQGEIIAVAANATVAGDVYQPPGRAAAPGLSIGGQLRAQAFALPPPCPCDAAQLLDVAAIVAQGRAKNDNAALGLQPDALYQTASQGPLLLECGRFAFDGGSILDQAQIVARGRSALFIHGDLAITGRFAPDLGERGEMDVFVDGALVLADGAALGSPDRPAALRIYVGGAGDLLLTDSATLAAGVYAPHATLYVTGEQASYGALFLAGYYATADQRIHYDAALLRSARDPDACSEHTPRGGCQSDADCAPPFLCQAGSCSVGVE